MDTKDLPPASQRALAAGGVVTDQNGVQHRPEPPKVPQDDEGAPFMPSLAEIAARAAEVREGWSDEEHVYRARCCNFHLSRQDLEDAAKVSSVPVVEDPRRGWGVTLRS